MKKTILAAALALLAAAHASAQTTFASPTVAKEPSTKVTITKSSDTFVAVSVATQTPTSVVGDTTQMYSWVDIQNKSANDIVCGENSVSISTIPASRIGWVIDASTGSKRFDIVPGQDFYCQGCSVSAAQRITVVRGK